MTREQQEAKLEAAVVALDKALIEFDASKMKETDALINEAHDLADEVLTALPEDNDDLSSICVQLEGLREGDDLATIQDEDELKAVRNGIAEAKENLEQFELPEEEETE